MLRNSLKISICGLIASVLIGCSDTTPLLGDNVGACQCNSLDSIKIKADAYYEHVLRSRLSKILATYYDKLRNYKITVTLKEENDTAVYSDREVIKEQKRLIAHIEICDKNLKTVLEKVLDSFSTYEIKDEIPFASISSQKQVTNLLLNDISSNIGLVIIKFLKTSSQI